MICLICTQEGRLFALLDRLATSCEDSGLSGTVEKTRGVVLVIDKTRKGHTVQGYAVIAGGLLLVSWVRASPERVRCHGPFRLAVSGAMLGSTRCFDFRTS
jgi:hypothetical protein